jgi:hypothetical protein
LWVVGESIQDRQQMCHLLEAAQSIPSKKAMGGVCLTYSVFLA